MGAAMIYHVTWKSANQGKLLWRHISYLNWISQSRTASPHLRSSFWANHYTSGIQTCFRTCHLRQSVDSWKHWVATLVPMLTVRCFIHDITFTWMVIGHFFWRKSCCQNMLNSYFESNTTQNQGFISHYDPDWHQERHLDSSWCQSGFTQWKSMYEPTHSIWLSVYRSKMSWNTH